MKKDLSYQLRAAGIAFAVAGLLAAAVIFWARSGPEDPDVFDTDFQNKTHVLEMQKISGNAGVLTAEFNAWFVGLWQGRKLAFTIATLSIGAAGGLFFLAEFLKIPSSTEERE